MLCPSLLSLAMNDKDLECIERQLGRRPRGLKAVLRYNSFGEPQIIRVSPVVEGKPFPSIYWLTCTRLKKGIDQIESQGFIKKIENEILPADSELLERYKKNHLSYIDDRMQFLKEDGLENTLTDHLKESLMNRGIGGIQDFSKVRCLHMHYAHHLVKENVIGELIDEFFDLKNYL